MDEDFGVIKVDIRNAFNLASHQILLFECEKHFPKLLPWVSRCYSKHPFLWHSMGSLTSESGVQPGDPLGPLLFSLVLNILVLVSSSGLAPATSQHLFDAVGKEYGDILGTSIQPSSKY